MCSIDQASPSNPDRQNQGENLFWKTSKREIGLEKAAIDACQVWYSQIKSFDWENYRNHKNVVAQFTQVHQSLMIKLQAFGP